MWDIISIVSAIGILIISFLFFLKKPRAIINKNIVKVKRVRVHSPVTNGGKNVVGEGIAVRDILGFFEHDINPSYIESKIQQEKAAELGKSGKIPWLWIIIGVVVIVAAAVLLPTFTGGDLKTCNQELLKAYKSCPASIPSAPTAPITNSPTTPNIIGSETFGIR